MSKPTVIALNPVNATITVEHKGQSKHFQQYELQTPEGEWRKYYVSFGIAKAHLKGRDVPKRVKLTIEVE